MSDKNNPEIQDIKCEALPCFRRNNYFLGKLLTAEDFQVEQQYFVNKQRLLNRLIHGTGVVCGLEVIRRGPGAMDLTDSQIRITEGVALDSCGREIVVPRCVDLDLSEIADRKQRQMDVYVWISYNFRGEEKIPNTPQESNPKDCYNKIKEEYTIQVGQYPPTYREIRKKDSLSKNETFIENSEKTKSITKNCYKILENEILNLARVTIHFKHEKINVGNIDNLVGDRIVYSNVQLFNQIECLNKRIYHLENMIKSK